MVILGAGGHANEVLDIVGEKYFAEDIFLFDNTGGDTAIKSHRFVSLLQSSEALSEKFMSDPLFCIGVGKPEVRKALSTLASNCGGVVFNVIASTACVSKEASIGSGLNVMHTAYVSPGASVGDGVLVNAGALVHHDVFIGQYAEISPGATLLGGAIIGAFARVGARAVVMPGVTIGEGVVVGAGAVVLRDVDPYEVVVGVPASPIPKI